MKLQLVGPRNASTSTRRGSTPATWYKYTIPADHHSPQVLHAQPKKRKQFSLNPKNPQSNPRSTTHTRNHVPHHSPPPCTHPDPHNTRTHETQTFAIFKTDHQYDSVYGAPYGTCEAYTCAAPASADEITADADYWTFFWGDEGESDGEGAGCIMDPNSGVCGCESSDGKFVAGRTDCV
jgi:hypothetical protein